MPLTIAEERPDSPEALALLSELDEALWLHPYPPESRHAFTVDKLLREGVAFFVARLNRDPAACGGLKLFEADYGEVKRMYVRPIYRGRGLGRRSSTIWPIMLGSAKSMSCVWKQAFIRSRPLDYTSVGASNDARRLANTELIH